MNWPRVAIGSMLAFMAIPATALSDWQYTRWGMTKAQVMEASKGQALTHLVTNRENWGIYPELVAPSRFGAYIYRAYFYFDDDEGRLEAIRLVPKPGVWCPDVAKALLSRYGSDHRLIDGYYIWYDASDNTKISLSSFSTCRIKYEPLE